MEVIRDDLPDLLYTTILALGRKGSIVSISKKFWDLYEADLRSSGDLFYTWNYDMRWAARKLRKDKRMHPAYDSKKNKLGMYTSPLGIWEII